MLYEDLEMGTGPLRKGRRVTLFGLTIEKCYIQCLKIMNRLMSVVAPSLLGHGFCRLAACSSVRTCCGQGARVF